MKLFFFRDAGDAFKSICKTLVDNGKIRRFLEYEPCVHELLLPNDNRLRGRSGSGGPLTITERTMSNQPYFC